MKATTSTKEIKNLIVKMENKIKTLSGFQYELENKKGKLSTTDIEIIGVYQGEIFALGNIIDELNNIINK